MELLASGRGIGYLLKTRVTDVAEFLDTLGRIAKGGSVIDPAWSPSWSPPATTPTPWPPSAPANARSWP